MKLIVDSQQLFSWQTTQRFGTSKVHGKDAADRQLWPVPCNLRRRVQQGRVYKRDFPVIRDFGRSARYQQPGFCLQCGTSAVFGSGQLYAETDRRVSISGLERSIKILSVNSDIDINVTIGYKEYKELISICA